MMRPKIIVFTGPESSGKSYLTKKMSAKFDLPYIDEYARFYLEKLDRSYQCADLLEIARRQYDQLKKVPDHSNWTVMDTDGLTIKIWSQEKYQKVDPQIDELIQENEVFHYFLCRPDIPWESDPQRENELDRDRLFDIYLEQVVSMNIPFSIIQGSIEQREAIATDFFQKLIGNL